jgi:hypothetical protein
MDAPDMPPGWTIQADGSIRNVDDELMAYPDDNLHYTGAAVGFPRGHMSDPLATKDPPKVAIELYEMARKGMKQAQAEAVAVDERYRIASSGRDWLQGLVERLEHQVARPRITWELVPKLLHELQAFTADTRRSRVHFEHWAEKAPEIWASRDIVQRTTHDAFERSTAIWVSRDIAATVFAAAESFPSSSYLQATDLPFDTGLAVLEEEYSDSNYHGENVALSAISWYQHVKNGELG